MSEIALLKPLNGTGDTIAILAYDLFKIHWIHSHISRRTIRKVYTDYIMLKKEDDIYETFEQYINNVGFFGELYPCFGEFMDYEFQDQSFIKSLLLDDSLREFYEQAVKPVYAVVKWDTDDKNVDLPESVEIPLSVAVFPDTISDYLSDEYGWCVESFSLQQGEKKED